MYVISKVANFAKKKKSKLSRKKNKPVPLKEDEIQYNNITYE